MTTRAMCGERVLARRRTAPPLASLLVAALPSCLALDMASFVANEESRTLIERDPQAAPSSPGFPPLLLILLDGVGRDLLYDMLRAGELPGLGWLIGMQDREFPHAWFATNLVTTLPSSSTPAWVSALTGVPPAVHGIAGNEFFVRETATLAALLRATTLCTFGDEFSSPAGVFTMNRPRSAR